MHFLFPHHYREQLGDPFAQGHFGTWRILQLAQLALQPKSVLGNSFSKFMFLKTLWNVDNKMYCKVEFSTLPGIKCFMFTQTRDAYYFSVSHANQLSFQ